MRVYKVHTTWPASNDFILLDVTGSGTDFEIKDGIALEVGGFAN